MDQGLWGIWYNLREDARAEYLRWTEEEYFPFLQSQPGFAWVAHYRNVGGGPDMDKLADNLTRPGAEVPVGGQFLQLVGAPSAHAFFTPLFTKMPMPASYKQYLDLRTDVVFNVMTEVARVNGPAVHKRPEGTGCAPAIQMGTFRYRSPEEEPGLGEWYAQYRLPHTARMQGCIGTRKLVSVAGWAKHGVLYEFESLEARLNDFELPHEKLALDPKEWTGRIVEATIHIPGSPVIGPRIWPPVPTDA